MVLSKLIEALALYAIPTSATLSHRILCCSPPTQTGSSAELSSSSSRVEPSGSSSRPPAAAAVLHERETRVPRTVQSSNKAEGDDDRRLRR